MKAPDQLGIIGMVVFDKTVADQEINDHQGAIELEFVRIAHRLNHLFDRPQVEFSDFPVSGGAILGH